MNDVARSSRPSSQARRARAFEPEAMLRLVRAAVHDDEPPLAPPGPPSVRLDDYPDVATAWVLGTTWHALGRVPDRDEMRTGAARHRDGGASAVRTWALQLAPDPAHATSADADEVFVTGAYLAALGRLPDTDGRAAHVDLLRSSGEHAVLTSLLGSAEAGSQVRHPPAAPRRDVLLVEAVQEVVGGAPDVVPTLLQALREGRDVRWLVRTALRLRHGRLMGALRRPTVPALARTCLTLAAIRESTVLVSQQTAFAWRVHQQLEHRLEAVHGAVAELRARDTSTS